MKPKAKDIEPKGKSLFYLYCITKERPGRGDFAGMEVKTFPVEFRNIYAIVSKVSGREFGLENLKKNLADMKWVEKKVRLHEEVVEGIMKQTQVIPSKFATIFEREDNVKRLLEERYSEFDEMLSGLEGKEEWGVKVFCDMEMLKNSLLETEGWSIEIQERIDSSSAGKAFLLEKKKGQLIEEAKINSINEYGQEIFEILKDLSLDARINKLLPKEVTERNEEMILNSAFLVKKTRASRLVKAVNNLEKKYRDKGILFDCTGPWPAYNFCQLEK